MVSINSNENKPTIPPYVANWIEAHTQPPEDDVQEDIELALADSIHFSIYFLFADIPERNSDYHARKPVCDWLEYDRRNYWKLIDAVRYGYNIGEKLYRIKLIETENVTAYLTVDSLGEQSIEYIRDGEFFTSDKVEFTKSEIISMDKRYWEFAEEVK